MKCTEFRSAMLLMSTALVTFVGLVASSASGQAPAESVQAIINASVISGTGAPTLADQTIVIRGKNIISITHRGPVPAGARVFDAKGMSVLPGLVAMHDHLENPYHDSRMYLAHGVTTLRIAGSRLILH